MPTVAELLRQGRKQELWQRCCGFIDLSLEEFMVIQRRLLLEQIELLKNCELGRKVMRGAMPTSVDEFREQVPLTTYADYAPYLLEKREDVLPMPPVTWQRTAGVSDEYPYKLAPVTKRFLEEMPPTLVAMYLLSTCRDRKNFDLPESVRLLYLLAPPPYMTGTLGRQAAKELDFIMRFIPPLNDAESMSFEERIKKGFEQALEEGIDAIFGIASVLVAVGEKFAQGAGPKDLNALISLLSKPGLLLRLTKASLKSKLARRPMFPKDIWPIKGLMTGGTDTAIYRAKIKERWGRTPLDVYACAEGFIIAMQTWDYEGMTFVPDFNLLEFVPEDEHLKLKADPSYQPKSFLLDEVKPKENYEIIITNFHGGPFTRYRLGDIIRITSLRNEKLNIDIPQMVFHSRADDIIDFAAFTHAFFTEKIIWQAIENSGIDYVDWVVRKEIEEVPVLRLYLETKEDSRGREEELATMIDRQLKILQEDYAHLEEEFGLKLFKLTLLPRGAFQEYISRQRAAGAELAHLKPLHINPPDSVIETLLGGSHAVLASSR